MSDKHKCTLELSKCLKDLGVKQESSYYWVRKPESNNYILGNAHIYGNEYYSAFTVGELGEMLPEGYLTYKIKDCCGDVFYWINADYNRVESGDIGRTMNVWNTSNEKTEANARAKMLIYLIENKLVKVEDL